MLISETEKLSQRKVFLIAGLSIIVMAVCAGLTYGYIHSSLVVNGNTSTTINNIVKSSNLFHLEILGWTIILILDILTAWSLYVLLKQTDKSIAFLVAIFRLMYAAILSIAVSHLISINAIINEGQYLSNLSDVYKFEIIYNLDSFEKVWSFGLILFGLHLIILSYLLIKSGYISKIIGYVLLISGLSYELVHLLYLFSPQFDYIALVLEKTLSLPMAVGEISLGLWLLYKGVKI